MQHTVNEIISRIRQAKKAGNSKAIASLCKAVEEVTPDDSLYNLLLGLNLLEQELYSYAVPFCKKAVEAHPEEAAAHYSFGVSLARELLDREAACSAHSLSTAYKHLMKAESLVIRSRIAGTFPRGPLGEIYQKIPGISKDTMSDILSSFCEKSGFRVPLNFDCLNKPAPV